MRQAGILAAAGIISLTKMMDRMKEDHANAKLFAEGYLEICYFCICNYIILQYKHNYILMLLYRNKRHGLRFVHS